MSDTPNIDWGIAVAELANAVGASFRHNQEDGFIEWTNGTPPTEEVIQAEIVRLQTEYDAQEYARNRASEYPSLLELTVALYDTDDKSAVEAKRAAVKLKYPKPS